MDAKREDLDALDLLVMEALTTARRTATTVTLAATVWTGPGTWSDGPINLVQSIVESLGERGLLTYAVPTRERAHVRPYRGMFKDIRLTPKGWTLMGYPVLHYQVGTHLATSMRLDKHGDRTNFRKHNTYAEGGPIEVDDFPTHRATYPHHIHMYGDSDMTVQATPPTRQYIKVTPEMEAHVIATRAKYPTESYDSIAETCALPKRTIEYILTDLPRLRRMNDGEVKAQGTLKQRILWTLDVLPVEDVRAFRRILGRLDTDHDIVHVLHDLHKQGWVDFDESTAGKSPTNIHMTARGKGQGLPKVERETETVVEENPLRLDNLDGTTGVTVTDLGRGATLYEPNYPLLDELLAREGKRIAGDNKSFKYMEAADLIRDEDPETAALLDEKAKANDIPFPSPVEAEYLRYVAAHTKETAE
jgi:hypothetical protein